VILKNLNRNTAEYKPTECKFMVYIVDIRKHNSNKLTEEMKQWEKNGESNNRFSIFLDKINFSISGRWIYGASLCSVSVNYFKKWCDTGIATGTQSDLEGHIKNLLEYQGIHNIPARKIVAWLLSGDEADNPWPELHSAAAI
jgi:hypothetical protein